MPGVRLPLRFDKLFTFLSFLLVVDIPFVKGAAEDFLARGSALVMPADAIVTAVRLTLEAGVE